MPICAVCGKENESLLCKSCGFDGSCDYEHYPSLAEIPPESLSIGRLALQKKTDRTVIHCPECQGTSFTILTENLACICAACGTEMNRDHIKVQQKALADEKTRAIFEKQKFKAFVPGFQHQFPHNNLAISAHHTILVQKDGSVKAAGQNLDRQCNVNFWKDIEEVAATDISTIGRTSDGTVLVTGSAHTALNIGNASAISAGESNAMILHDNGTVTYLNRGIIGKPTIQTLDWNNIAAIAAGQSHAVGLHTDGTVESLGSNQFGQCDVSGWNGVAAVAAGSFHTIGLRSDGTVLAAGCNLSGQCDVEQWDNNFVPITAIAAGHAHTVILRKDGTVAAIGSNDQGQCNVSHWKDVVTIAAAGDRTVGLTKSGKLLEARMLASDDALNNLQW